MLVWNHPRIQDALSKLPAHLKNLPNDIETPAGADGETEGLHVGTQQQADAVKQPVSVISSNLNGQRIKYVQTRADLQKVTVAQLFSTAEYCSVDCEGVPDSLELIQVASDSGVWVFDCAVIGAEVVCEALRPLLESDQIIKVLHDLHNDALALVMHGKVTITNTLDSQLAAEYLWGDLHLGFNSLLEKLDQPPHTSKKAMKREMQRNSGLWSKRPLSADCIEYAALDVLLLQNAIPALLEKLGDVYATLIEASDARVASSVASDHEVMALVLFALILQMTLHSAVSS